MTRTRAFVTLAAAALVAMALATLVVFILSAADLPLFEMLQDALDSVMSPMIHRLAFIAVFLSALALFTAFVLWSQGLEPSEIGPSDRCPTLTSPSLRLTPSCPQRLLPQFM